MISLWELLVVDMFGSFWLAVFGLTFLMWIIFVIGKVSQVTSLNFLSIFILAITIGYGNLLITIFLTILLVLTHLLAVPKLINS